MFARRNLRLTVCFSCLALLSEAFSSPAAAQSDPEPLDLAELNTLLGRAASLGFTARPASGAGACLAGDAFCNALRVANAPLESSGATGDFIDSLGLIGPSMTGVPLARLRAIDPSGYLADYARGLDARRKALLAAGETWYELLTRGLEPPDPADPAEFRTDRNSDGTVDAADRIMDVSARQAAEAAKLQPLVDTFSRDFRGKRFGIDSSGAEPMRCTDFTDEDCIEQTPVTVGSLSRSLELQSVMCINENPDNPAMCLSDTTMDNKRVDELLLSEAARAERALRGRIQGLYFSPMEGLTATELAAADRTQTVNRVAGIVAFAEGYRTDLAGRQQAADTLVTSLATIYQRRGLVVDLEDLGERADAFYGVAGARERSERADVLQDIAGQPLEDLEMGETAPDGLDRRYDHLRRSGFSVPATADEGARSGASPLAGRPASERGESYGNLYEFLGGERGLGILLNPHYDVTAGTDGTMNGAGTSVTTVPVGAAGDPTEQTADPYAYLNYIIKLYNAQVVAGQEDLRVALIVPTGASALADDEDLNEMGERDTLNLRRTNPFQNASPAAIRSVLETMVLNIAEGDLPFDTSSGAGTTVQSQRDFFSSIIILFAIQQYEEDTDTRDDGDNTPPDADARARALKAARPVEEARPYATMSAALRAEFETSLRCELDGDATDCPMGRSRTLGQILADLMGEDDVRFSDMLRVIAEDGSVTYEAVQEDLRVSGMLNGEVNAVMRENRLGELEGRVEGASVIATAAQQQYEGVVGDLAAIASVLQAAGGAPEGAQDIVERLAPVFEVGDRLEDQRSGLAMAASLGDVHVSPGRRINLTVSSSVYDGRYPAVALQMGMRLAGSVILSGGVAYGTQSSDFGGRFSLAGGMVRRRLSCICFPSKAFCLATLLAAAGFAAPVFVPRAVAQEVPEPPPLDESGFNAAYAERITTLYTRLSELATSAGAASAFDFTSDDLRALIEGSDDVDTTGLTGIALAVANGVNTLREWRMEFGERGDVGDTDSTTEEIEVIYNDLRAFGARAVGERVAGLEAGDTLGELASANEVWLNGPGGGAQPGDPCAGLCGRLQSRLDTLIGMLDGIGESGSLAELTTLYSVADEEALFARARNLERGALSDEQVPLDDYLEDTNGDGVIDANDDGEFQDGILTQNEKLLSEAQDDGTQTGVLPSLVRVDADLDAADASVEQFYGGLAERGEADTLRELATRVDDVLAGRDFEAMNALLDEVDRGIAMAMALSGLSVSTNRDFKAAISSGVYRSEVAMAAQFGWRLDRNIVLNGGFGYTFADQRLSGRLGVNFQW